MKEFFGGVLSYSREHGEALALFLVFLLSLVTLGTGGLLAMLESRQAQNIEIVRSQAKLDLERQKLEYERTTADIEKLKTGLSGLDHEIQKAKADVDAQFKAELRRLRLEYQEFVSAVNRGAKEQVSTAGRKLESEREKFARQRAELDPLLDEVQRDLEEVERMMLASMLDKPTEANFVRTLIRARLKLNLLLTDFRAKPGTVEFTNLEPIEYMPPVLDSTLSFQSLDLLSNKMAALRMVDLGAASIIQMQDKEEVSLRTPIWLLLGIGSFLLVLFFALTYHAVRRRFVQPGEAQGTSIAQPSERESPT